MRLSNWINISIENPLKTWWKARKYFKRPKLQFGIFYSSIYMGWKILDMECHDIKWKDKYDTPRHIRSPHIYIALFGKFGINIDFQIEYKNEFGEKQHGDMFYWEYLLSWLYYKKELKDCESWVYDSVIYKEVEYAEDSSDDTEIPMKCVIPTVAMSLNKRGIKELKKELNIIGIKELKKELNIL